MRPKLEILTIDKAARTSPESVQLSLILETLLDIREILMKPEFVSTGKMPPLEIPQDGVDN